MLIVYPTQGDNNGRYISYLAEHGIPTHEIYGHGALSPILLYKINKLLKKGKYDLIQSNLIHADFWIAVMKRFRGGFKMLSVKHGYHPSYQAKHGHNTKHLKHDLYYWVAKFASRTADFNVTISRGLYSIYTDGRIVDSSRIKNIYYGLTLEKPIHNTNHVQVPDEPFVLITGRLVGFKGHPYLIEAWKKVHDRHPRLKLYIAGDGNRRGPLEEQVKQADLQDSIVFLGHVPNPHPYMEKSLFTIVSSVWEGFGLILLESWLHKKAIIAFDVPAMNEVVEHERNGLLAIQKNPEDLSKKIIHLYENQVLAKEYGQNGYEKLNSYYTLRRMTDETEQVYQAVIAGKPVPLEN
jgi:glycosyltransferase involved in cell wall biosynthesis